MTGPSHPARLAPALLLLPHQHQELDEVEINRHRRVNSVVVGVRQAGGPVQVEDDQTGEHDQREPVDHGHGALDRKAEEAHEWDDEAGTDDKQ